MKRLNNENKRIGIVLVIVILIFVSIFEITYLVQYNQIKVAINVTINTVVNNVVEKYPLVNVDEIVSILKEKNNFNINVLAQYGYDNEHIYIANLEAMMQKNAVYNGIIILCFSMIFCIVFVRYIFKRNIKVEEINKYLGAVNRGDYTLNIEDNDEDELSRLRNEVYKTTILLKEVAENSVSEKEKMSTSLADISHQLKTPLTSMQLMIDNIIETPEMDEETKKDFITEISKQIDWMSSLVISLLKLAKFDAGVIIMNRNKVQISELIQNVVANLSVLIDVKNITIDIDKKECRPISVDYKWQLEAITNIVKNAIEHSKENAKICIGFEDSNFFLKVRIIDEGHGIDNEDKKHIFERFYKAKNSSENSIGIGLALAKTIVEMDNGYISVDSEIGKGTIFEIKYMRI